MIMRRLFEREKHHPVLSYPVFLGRVAICWARYRRVLKRLRCKNGPLKAVFLSAGTAKWKCQSVYEEMIGRGGVFEPVVVCDKCDRDFYVNNGCEVSLDATSAVKDADIVIYQDPWADISRQFPVIETSTHSLCCYIPYSIESIAQRGRSERFDYHHLADFHSLMFACFQWSEAYAKHYETAQFPFEWAGKILGFGHPSLDFYFGSNNQGGTYIIYAPHFGFEYNGIMPISSIGTFPWSGRAILEYAKAHPEQKWLFKPHPKLRDRLSEIGFMTRSEVGAYYSEWERIAQICYDGNYAKWFIDSKAMVTDSNSFLLEYMAVGKPLIHLTPAKTNMIPCEEAGRVFKTFYTAKSTNEMYAAFKRVLEDGEDTQKEERIYAAKESEVFGNHAGKRIVTWLTGQIYA